MAQSERPRESGRRREEESGEAMMHRIAGIDYRPDSFDVRYADQGEDEIGRVRFVTARGCCAGWSTIPA
jgi:hypothetical protein